MACVPGGTTSTMFTNFSKGNLALSVLMTVTATVFGVVLIPLILVVSWVPRNWQFLMETLPATYVAAIALGVFGIAIGYAFARVLRLHPRNARTVALETGIQNGPLAIAIIAFTGTEAQSYMAVPALYALFIVIISTLVTLIFRRANTAAEQKLPDGLL